MNPIVLVHGHCHGAWCWERVVPLLRTAGYPVWTPTLTGMGERRSELRSEIGLNDHIRDVVDLVEREDLRDVVLVGHSYAGMVIAGAAARLAERIGALVYLDAPVPAHGESLFDCLPVLREPFHAVAVDGWRLDPPDPAAWGVTQPEDREWVTSLVTPVTLKSCEDPVDLSMARDHSVRRSYIRCTESPLTGPIADARRAEPGWMVHEIETGHDAMITRPDLVAAAIFDACRNVPNGAPSANRDATPGTLR
jgi:pimeloyl-ACP methyl ester carboxylesterase